MNSVGIVGENANFGVVLVDSNLRSSFPRGLLIVQCMVVPNETGQVVNLRFVTAIPGSCDRIHQQRKFVLAEGPEQHRNNISSYTQPRRIQSRQHLSPLRLFLTSQIGRKDNGAHAHVKSRPFRKPGPSIPPSMESHLSDHAISLKSFVSMRYCISLPISQCIPDIMAILWFHNLSGVLLVELATFGS